MSFIISNTGGGSISEVNVWRPALSESDTAQQIADKISTDIAAASAVDGIVKLPAGKFTSRTITWDPRVTLLGAGKRATQITSVAAEPLIEYVGDTLYNPTANIGDMTLLGGVDTNTRTGTTALNLKRIAFFNHRNLTIKFFAANAMEFEGVLLGQFENVDIKECHGGINAIKATTSSQGGLQSNLVIFHNCSFTKIKDNWCVQWDMSAGIQFRGCDFERSGASGLGLIKLTNFSPNGEGQGLIIDGAWGEYNSGTLIDVQGHADANYTIRDSMFQYPTGTPTKALIADGGKFLFDHSTFHTGYGITMVNGDLETVRSIHGTVSLQNASTHKIYQPVTA